MKRVYADVDDDLFRKFQIKLAEKGDRMAPVIRKMVEEYTSRGDNDES